MPATGTIDIYSETAVTEHDFFFWGAFSLSVVGCFMELLLLIFFCNEFQKPSSSHLKAAYFILLNYGYLLDIIATMIWNLAEVIQPDHSGKLTVAGTIVIFYSEFQLGFWSTLLGINRYTALVYPFIHNKVRRSKSNRYLKLFNKR